MRNRSRDDRDGEGRGSVRVTPSRVDTRRTAGTTTATGAQQGLPTTAAGLLALQRAAGNAAVCRSVTAQRHAACEEETDPTAVQRRTSVHDVLGTSGRPLAEPVRQDMEARFDGADFAGVRIHDDAAARRSAQEIGARAYTSGSHIVIGDGGGDPHTLAHELTHVVQQSQGPVAGTDHGNGLHLSDPSDRFERAAEDNARKVLSGPAPTTGTTGAVQRAVAGPAAGTPAGKAPAVQRTGGFYGSATASRPSRTRTINLDSLPGFIRLPSYTSSTTPRAGGVRSHVVLGPNGYSSRGTDADSRKPPAIVRARDHYRIPFVAGHLLNADFGGDGQTSKNLTILTPRANSRMKRFDNPLKTAAGMLRRVYRDLAALGCPIDVLAYGIEITVSTSGPEHVWSDSYPGSCISQFIYCSADVKGVLRIEDWYADHLNNRSGDPRTDRAWGDVMGDVDRVNRLVEEANQFDVIDNEWYSSR